MAAHGKQQGRHCGLRPAWCTTLFALAVTAGCSNNHEQLKLFLRAGEAEVSTGQYVVRPPDRVTIHAPGAPELDGSTQTVRADGKVALRLLGEVDIAGLTTEEIARKLETQLARYYVEPQVVVQVSGYASKCYYVMGEVATPGPKPYTGRDTLLTALADARPTFLAWRQQITVTRPAPKPGAEPQKIVVDLDKLAAGGDPELNVLLQEGDVVEVPPTPLAWVGQRVRELLYPIDPIVRTYNAPAEAVRSTRVYEDEFGGGNEDHRNYRDRLFGP